MYNYQIKSFCVVVLFTTVCNVCHAQNDFSIITSKITAQEIEKTSEQNILKNVIAFLPAMQSNGSWQDLDYSNTDITKWKPGQHLDRLKSLSVAFVKEGGLYYNNTAVWQALQNGLRFWYEKNPQSKNWWHNEIASPKTLGLILLLIEKSGKQLPGNLQQQLVQRMTQGNVFEKTGANKLDIAIHMIYRACITKDAALMDTAVQQAFQPIEFTKDEGIQYDTSYMQHGSQLQISSYGLVFLQGEYKVANWVQGTSYSLQGEKLKLLDAYLVHTFLPSIRGSYIDFNTEGRGISRKGILDKHALASLTDDDSFLQIAKALSPQNAVFIANSISRINGSKPAAYEITAAHRHFWNGDYTQHIRPQYSFNVRMVSSRSKRTESGNKENLLGKFLPDGSTNIQRSGSEYFNIMPAWEWDKIPGTTSRDFKTDQPITAQWGEEGNTTFAGGVSDGDYGASAYSQNYDSVQAKKSWFFFDKEVVSLGAGIKSNAPENITTTINQCWLNAKVAMNENSPLRWAWQDSIGYFFPGSQPFLSTTGLQKGNWKKINSSQPDETVEGNVFKMWFDHGQQPANAAYAYITVPGVDVNDMKSYDASIVNIIANTEALQAVEHKNLNVLEAVFYTAGIVEASSFSISVDEPCVVLVKNLNGKFSIHVADPTQHTKEINLVLTSKSTGEKQKLTCTLPVGHFAGSSTHFEVQL